MCVQWGTSIETNKYTGRQTFFIVAKEPYGKLTEKATCLFGKCSCICVRESSFNMARRGMKILKLEAWNFSSPHTSRSIFRSSLPPCHIKSTFPYRKEKDHDNRFSCIEIQCKWYNYGYHVLIIDLPINSVNGGKLKHITCKNLRVHSFCVTWIRISDQSIDQSINQSTRLLLCRGPAAWGTQESDLGT